MSRRSIAWQASSSARGDATILQKDRDRLDRILGLLGSDNLGERASAAKAASEFMKKHDLTWRELIEGGAAPATSKAAKRYREVSGVDYLAAAESRVRQLQAHTMRLERQIRLLKEKLEEQ